VLWIGFLYPNLPPASLLKSQSQSGSDHQNTQPRWLIFTMSPVDSLTRRDSIRHTWQALYASPVFETRFVLANYNDSWSPSIEKENRTYGDLVRLETVQSGARRHTQLRPLNISITSLQKPALGAEVTILSVRSMTMSFLSPRNSSRTTWLPDCTPRQQRER